MRELEQAVRRILLTGRYAPDSARATEDADPVFGKLRAGELTAAELLARYSAMLHRRLGTYAEVAKRTGLDPRTTRNTWRAQDPDRRSHGLRGKCRRWKHWSRKRERTSTPTAASA